MHKILEKPLVAVIILAAVCGYFFFLSLGGFALTDPDETFYAQTAKEMVAKGDWVTPYLYGNPQFEKPIFFYWLLEASFKAFGVNEFSARLPSAVFAFIGVIAVYLLGALLFNKKAGFLAGLILAVNVEYVILSRACVTDMVLSTLMLLGFLFFFYGYIREKKYFYLLSSAAFAFAVLTKGPVAIILPLAIIGISVIILRDWSIFKKIPIAASILVFFAVALPWYVMAYRLHGKAFIDAFFGFQNVTRFLQAEHKIGSQFYYNIPVLLAGFFPWSAFLPFALWRSFKKGPGASGQCPGVEKRAMTFLLAWIAVIFVFFSISSTKLPTYIFPLFPAAALITAALWDEFLKDRDGSIRKGMAVSYYILVAAIFAGIAALYIFINFDYEYKAMLCEAALAGIPLVVLMLLSFIRFLRKRYLRSFFLIVLAPALFLIPLKMLIIPEIEVYETSKKISREALSRMKEGERIGCEHDYRAGVAFYTNNIPADISPHHLLTQFLSSNDRVWCVMKEKNFHQLYDLDDKPYYKKPSYLVYRLGKKCIFTNKAPKTGGYILKRDSKK